MYWLRAAEKASDPSATLINNVSLRQRGDWDERLCGYVAYKSAFLLEALILSLNLRTCSSVKGSIQAAFQLFPGLWQKSLTNLMSGEHSMASAATLSRARLIIDVSCMIFWRRKYDAMLSNHLIPPVLFMLVDSSPQGPSGGNAKGPEARTDIGH